MAIDEMSNREYIAIKGEQVAELMAENESLRKKYNDLIYQVATKFPNETRHDTARRYIREREDRSLLEGTVDQAASDHNGQSPDGI